jgi:hypothetical protein
MLIKSIYMLFTWFAALWLHLFSPTSTHALGMHAIPDLRMPEKTTLHFHIVFGRLREDGDCRGFGICDFSLEIKGGKSAEAPNSARGEATAEDGKLLLKIPLKDGLSARTRETYFSGTHFKMDAAYTLPQEVCQRLGLPPRYLIAIGLYPLVRNPDFLLLRL